MYIYKYTYIYIYIFTYAYIFMCVCVWACACACVCVCLCLCVCGVAPAVEDSNIFALGGAGRDGEDERDLLPVLVPAGHHCGYHGGGGEGG